MTQSDVPAELDPAPSAPTPQRKSIAWYVEQLIPIGVGLLFLYTGITKALDGSKIHRVFAFDGVPQQLIVPLTHAVWVGEVILGLLLVSGIARRRAVMAAILVLFVYSVQLAYLIAADNPPRDCACVEIMARFASAKQQLVLGLVRNAVLAAGLEWVRLRMVGRVMREAPPSEAQKNEDG